MIDFDADIVIFQTLDGHAKMFDDALFMHFLKKDIIITPAKYRNKDVKYLGDYGAMVMGRGCDLSFIEKHHTNNKIFIINDANDADIERIKTIYKKVCVRYLNFKASSGICTYYIQEYSTIYECIKNKSDYYEIQLNINYKYEDYKSKLKNALRKRTINTVLND
jgi:hypothetical protein